VSGPGGAGTAPETRLLRIGDVAERVGTTPRTIRYYEEIGLLPESGERAQGKHRLYDEHDVKALSEVIRLRDLLGLSLAELGRLVQVEAERTLLHREWKRSETEGEMRRVLEALIRNLGERLALVEGRLAELESVREELLGRRERLLGRLEDLGPEGDA
jgi:DNA-binding transcriptional MerR regulator